MTKTIKLDTTFQGWVRRLCFALVFVFGQYALSAQTTATFTCTGTTGSFKSGSVNSGGTKNDGNMITVNSSANRGWATYDISSIPGGSTIVSANLLFTTYTSTLSSATNNCYGFIGDPATLSGTALYTACASGTTWNATSWTANALQTKAVSAAGITFIGANLGGNINVGYVRGSTNTYNIYGYSGVTPPQLQITYISSTPCAGQPTPGNTLSSAAAACPTVPFILSLQNAVGGSGITYQWESADDAGFTVNATNLGTGSTQSASQTSAKYYRCLVTCTNSGLSDYSVPVLVNVNSFLSCYCIPTTTNGCVSGDHITNVTFTSNANPINNTTGACLSASYSDYTAIQASVTQGDMVSVSVTVNNGGTEYAAGWIDFDQSGTFDAGEFIALTDADGIAPWVYNGTVTIPLTATVGITGMRFRSSYNATIAAGSACGTYSFGETEDYRVDIAQTFACSGQPTPGNTTGPSNICPNISFTLGLQNPPTSTGNTFQWESADDAGFSVNVVSLGTSITQSASQTSDKYYRCLVTCTNSGLSDYSAPLFVTTNNFLACYCPANSSFGSSGNFYGVVDNVTFDAINQTSGFPATSPYYTDYPTPTAQITQGVPTPISISVGQYTQVGVWIDFDQSGTFDASEFTFLGNNVNTPGVVYNGTINVPITATTGLTKMRVRSEAYFYANLVGTQACGLTNYGETEDYSININASVACSGQPVPGNTVTNVASVCPNGTVNLSLQNIATLGTGVTFQWERADDAGFSTNLVALGTNSTESTVQTTASYYRCNVTCSNSGLSDYSVAAFVSMNPAYNCTCASAPTQAADEEIYNVTIGSGSTDPLYANANGCATPAPGPGSSLGRYSNFKTLPPIAAIEAGATTSFTVEENECDGATYYAFGTGIWADLNQDGDFDDAGEELFKETATAVGPRNITGTFTIPVTATVGLTALRITVAEGFAGATLTPCLSYGYGETEDFLIDVTPATICGGVPAPGNTLASVSSACPNQPFTLSLQNSNLGGGITLQWESADDASFTVNLVSLGTGLTETVTQTSDKYYRCVVTCTYSGLSDFSTPIFIATNNFLSCYCPASSSFGSSGNFYGLLTNVSLDAINNTTGFPAVAPYYTDYPTPTAQITQGVLAPISITVDQYTQAVFGLTMINLVLLM
jgi:ligand-binding sensor protein